MLYKQSQKTYKKSQAEGGSRRRRPGFPSSVVRLSSLTLEPLSVPVDADLLCGHCGQNLRGVSSDRCPECGHRFDRARTLGANIPWEQRRRLGRFRAYWRTVRLITFHGPAQTDDAEVTLKAARSFRSWTLELVCLTMVALIIFWRENEPTLNSRNQTLWLNFRFLNATELPKMFRNTWFFCTFLIAVVLWINTTITVCDWFFHPKRLSLDEQRRAVARSCYSIAPLAWIPVLALLAVLFLGVESSYDRTPIVFYPAAAIVGTLAVLCGLCPVVYFCGVLRLLYRVTRSRRRGVAAMLLLPILWALMAVVIFVGLQFAVNYVALFFDGVRQ